MDALEERPQLARRRDDRSSAHGRLVESTLQSIEPIVRACMLTL
jgi:hypothetical protein